MMGHFLSAIDAHFESSRHHPQYQVWKNYALATNERGSQVAQTLKTWVSTFAGLRTLDVGSGYGGTCIALAQAGAQAFGIEIDSNLLSLAEANKADHPGALVTMTRMDAMDWGSLRSLGTFDVITCDNVIEHVPNPQVLIAHLRRLLKSEGVLYLTAPNAFSFGQILSECHYGRPGLSLLDTVDGSAYLREALGTDHYDVSDYFTLDSYRAMFARYGFHHRLLNPVRAAEVEVSEVRSARESIASQLPIDQVPQVVRAKVERSLKRRLEACDADLRWFDAIAATSVERAAFGHRLFQEYCCELWYFALSPTQSRIEPAQAMPTIRHDALLLANRVRAAAINRFSRWRATR
jgi:2-polyprenyl-3-methyl-5-hydroxy-6-metoxy-1,4-benzoquinol methylase